jgi:hypothetical protein
VREVKPDKETLTLKIGIQNRSPLGLHQPISIYGNGVTQSPASLEVQHESRSGRQPALPLMIQDTAREILDKASNHG